MVPLRTIRVLIIGATSDRNLADVVSKIKNTNRFAVVDYFNAHTSTPSLAYLLLYDSVFAFSDTFYADPNALGNTLADYINAGRCVVAATNSFSVDERLAIGG